MLRPIVLRLLALLAFVPAAVAAQAGKFPPDSLINVKVFAKSTPVPQVLGAMRNIAVGLGVRCHFCHAGEEGTPFDKTDFASDERRSKKVARQMMRMVQEINARLDTIPERPSAKVEVTCRTCHRGVSRPVPLGNLVYDDAVNVSADSAIRSYQQLRARYYGRDAYDFGEQTLPMTAFRLAREGKKFDDALKVLAFNETVFPNSSATASARGNVLLLKGDTSSAVTAFKEALKRDSTNGEARGRLRDLGAR